MYNATNDGHFILDDLDDAEKVEASMMATRCILNTYASLVPQAKETAHRVESVRSIRNGADDEMDGGRSVDANNASQQSSGAKTTGQRVKKTKPQDILDLWIWRSLRR